MKKEVNFTTTNLQLRTKKKNNLGHPTLPLYSITYLLHTKLASFGIFCQLWQKNCICQRISSKRNRRRRFLQTCAYDSTFNKNRPRDLLSLDEFSEFFNVSMCIYFRFRHANFYLCVLGKQKNSENLKNFSNGNLTIFIESQKICASLFPLKSFGLLKTFLSCHRKTSTVQNLIPGPAIFKRRRS